VGQTLAVVLVGLAVLGAALRSDPPAPPSPPPAPAVKTKPRVKSKIRVVKPVGDDSNSSYAALGIRATWAPADAPSWMHRAARQLESVNRSLTSSLKELARKSILGPV